MTANTTQLVTEIQNRINALTGATTAKDLLLLAKLSEGLSVNDVPLETVLSSKIAAVTGSTSLPELLMLKKAAVMDSVPVVGQVVQGYLDHDARFVNMNGARYLTTAYPDIPPSLLTTLGQQVEPNRVTAQSSMPPPTGGNGYDYWRGYHYDGTYHWFMTASNINPTLGAFRSTDGTNWVRTTVRTPPTNLTSVYWDAMVSNGTRRTMFGSGNISGSIVMLVAKSDDSGMTWEYVPYTPVITGFSYANGGRIAVASIGSNICAIPAGTATIGRTVWYSVNDGTTWNTLTTLSGAHACLPVATATRFIFFNIDGTAQYTANATPNSTSTALTSAQTGINSALAMRAYVTVAGKLVVAGQGGKLITSPDGIVWTNQGGATGLGDINQMAAVGTRVLFLDTANTSTGVLRYCDDAPSYGASMAIPADAEWFSTPAITTEVHCIGSDSTKFHIITDVSLHLKTSTLLAGSWSGRYYELPASTQTTNTDSIIKKYGLWIASYQSASVNNTGGVAAYYDNYASRRVYSTDEGVTWKPINNIHYGYGYIIDAGSRLLALDINGLLFQSTDGINWNTTGITRPTYSGGTVMGGKLYRVGTYTFVAVTMDSQTNNMQFDVSLNDGASWSDITSQLGSPYQYTRYPYAPFMLYGGALFFMSLYYDGSANTTMSVYKSTNGTAWSVKGSLVYNSNIPREEAGLATEGDALYAYFGNAAPTFNNTLVSYDGEVFSAIDSSTLPAGISMALSPNSLKFCDYWTGSLAIHTRDITSLSVRQGNTSNIVTIRVPYDSAGGRAPMLLRDGDKYRVFSGNAIFECAESNITFTVPTHNTTPKSYMRVVS